MAVTAGVDVASQARGTAACWIDWDRTPAVVLGIEEQVDLDRLREIIHDDGAAKVGLDVPLGWPRAFVDALAAHQSGRSWEQALIGQLTRRETDRWVMREHLGVPLSVAADRIAYPALRVAALTGGLDRSGTGRIVEVYPAAALRVWGLEHRRYKREAGRERRAMLITAIQQRMPWLAVDQACWRQCRKNDDALDALVAALVARASQLHLCHPIPDEHRAAAELEGWIAVPKSGTLEHLSGAGARDRL